MTYRRALPRIEWGTDRVLFKYRPGDTGYTHTRADASTCASYMDENGVLQYAAANVLRDGHYIGGVRHTLLEPSATNLCLRSEDFGSAPWTSVGTVSRTAAAHTASGTTLDLLGDTDAAALSVYAQTITLPSGTAAFSVDLKQGSAAITTVKLRATGVADRGRLVITWVDGVPSVVASIGTYLGAEARADGVYRLYCSAPGVVATDTNSIQVYPAGDVTSAATGTVYAGAVQVVASASPSSYIPTTSAAVTRAADSLYWPVAFAPQELTVCVRGVERGMYAPSAGERRSLHIGSSNISLDARLSMGKTIGSSQPFGQYDGGVSAVVSGVAVPIAPVVGDTVEHRVALSSDWKVTSGFSLNGAVETVAPQTAASESAASWAAGVNRLYLTGDFSSSNGEFAYESVVILSGTQTMARMRAAAGADATAFASVITMAYPLDEAVSHSPPAEGSQIVFHPSGIVDGWDAGSTHKLSGVVRWIPSADSVTPAATGWDGDAGWNAFLQWARRGNAFWFCPDASDLSTGWTMHLEMPWGEAPTLEPDGSRALAVTFRALEAVTGY